MTPIQPPLTTESKTSLRSSLFPQIPAPVRPLPKDPPPKENPQPLTNRAAEDVMSPLPPPTARTSELELKNETDEVPVVAFKDRRSLRNLEEIQTHQQAGEVVLGEPRGRTVHPPQPPSRSPYPRKRSKQFHWSPFFCPQRSSDGWRVAASPERRRFFAALRRHV